MCIRDSRWFDLVRMGGAKEAMKAEGHTIQDFQFLYPIPKTELDVYKRQPANWTGELSEGKIIRRYNYQ